MSLDKRAITEEVIKQLGLNINVKQGLAIWWWPDRGRTGVPNPRLTKAGMKAISKIKKPHEFPFDVRPTGNNLKRLMKIQTPFYIDFQGTIIFFSDELATAIIMYGSFDRYVQLLDD